MIREQKLPDDGRLGFVEVGVDPDREGDVSFGERLLVGQAGDEICTCERRSDQGRDISIGLSLVDLGCKVKR